MQATVIVIVGKETEVREGALLIQVEHSICLEEFTSDLIASIRSKRCVFNITLNLVLKSLIFFIHIKFLQYMFTYSTH